MGHTDVESIKTKVTHAHGVSVASIVPSISTATTIPVAPGGHSCHKTSPKWIMVFSRPSFPFIIGDTRSLPGRPSLVVLVDSFGSYRTLLINTSISFRFGFVPCAMLVGMAAGGFDELALSKISARPIAWGRRASNIPCRLQSIESVARLVAFVGAIREGRRRRRRVQHYLSHVRREPQAQVIRRSDFV